MADETTTFEENVRAQLENGKSQLQEIEALAKGRASQAVNIAINGLKNKEQEIDKKYQGLKTSADTKIKAEILADLDKFNVALGQVAAKLKSSAPSK
jgi:hypothetical protein